MLPSEVSHPLCNRADIREGCVVVEGKLTWDRLSVGFLAVGSIAADIAADAIGDIDPQNEAVMTDSSRHFPKVVGDTYLYRRQVDLCNMHVVRAGIVLFSVFTYIHIKGCYSYAPRFNTQ